MGKGKSSEEKKYKLHICLLASLGLHSTSFGLLTSGHPSIPSQIAYSTIA